MKSGIYQIINRVNNKRYVGSAASVLRRLKRHRYELNKNVHHNKHLQAAWNKYGESAFHFGVIVYCDKSELLTQEQIYLDTMCPEYNIAKNSTAPMLGRKHKEETLLKMSHNNTKENHPLWGKKHSAETILKMKESHPSGESSPKYGKKPSPETVEKMRASQKKLRENRRGTIFVDNKWRASICLNGKTKHLGVFLTEEEAHQAYVVAKIARDGGTHE